MSNYIQYFILIPFLALLFISFFSFKREKIIYGTTISAISIHFAGIILFLIAWIYSGAKPVFYEGLDLYKTSDTSFSIDFYFDKITAFYGFVAAFITFLVCIFSSTYMHRDKGYKRFFSNILLFYGGLNFIVFAGNFETLFIGWEIIGVASYLLISFYRDRYLPVKNALKVISYFRLADVFLLLAIWTCHHYFERSISMMELHNMQLSHLPVITDKIFAFSIPFLFLLVAMIKSAQFPFSSWLPRAMEGPTTSSAIFYGSLSVHVGAFLLLRTYPMWETNMIFKIAVITFGILTTFISNGIARVQSTVKTQIAYSSVAQIGIIFIEIALGLHWLALFHFAGNALLRTYQLLVSPSVLSYLIHDQFFNFIKPQNQIKLNFIGRIKMTLYILCIKEWNMDRFMFKYIWGGLKSLGILFSFLSNKLTLIIFIPLFMFGMFTMFMQTALPLSIVGYLPTIFSLIALVLILKSFTERKNAAIAWGLIILNQLFTSLSIGFNEQFSISQVYLFLSGIILSGIVGFWVLSALVKKKESISLDTFHGHSYLYPFLNSIFLIASLGLTGFPITPSFIGEDIILGHIHQNQYFVITSIALSLILDGVAMFRIYARLFQGPHTKINHELAYRAS
jgi:NADH:ubiquinone oxidoreductase subunit 5 (subunit L)/multisubunit Na+/H+ antiporter MnhA subunit